MDTLDSPAPPREPILTLPGALTAYVGLLVAIHGIRALLPLDWDYWTIELFGFIPKRYDQTLLSMPFPGGDGAEVWTFVTYSLLHANLSHIGFNVLWLLPFGSALARRFGAVRFFAFMAVTAVAGALAHLVTHEHAIAPIIGAIACSWVTRCATAPAAAVTAMNTKNLTAPKRRASALPNGNSHSTLKPIWLRLACSRE